MAPRMAAAREAGAPLVVLDIPLLFEGRRAGRGAAPDGLRHDRARLRPGELQIERQMSRDGCDRDEAQRRVAPSCPIDEKSAMADYVIDNSGSRQQTERQVRQIYAQLTGGA